MGMLTISEFGIDTFTRSSWSGSRSHSIGALCHSMAITLVFLQALHPKYYEADPS
jgi:hypothetical protein